MDGLTFFGLEPNGVGHRSGAWKWCAALTSGTGALFGGCGLGACIEVMEQTTGRPCIWATAQFLSYAMPGSLLELDVRRSRCAGIR